MGDTEAVEDLCLEVIDKTCGKTTKFRMILGSECLLKSVDVCRGVEDERV